MTPEQWKALKPGDKVWIKEGPDVVECTFHSHETGYGRKDEVLVKHPTAAGNGLVFTYFDSTEFTKEALLKKLIEHDTVKANGYATMADDYLERVRRWESML